ncbi:MAG TPA: hypothetical protein H9739_04275 [Candidatus Agathobaculum pullistercoris]|nr:hypothetical protein [uncultured Agathobaculum sp.]HIX10784.1 hypothetical protein [Candidatus Agathobaculum pullistercoris]
MNELSALWEAAPWLVAGGALVIINIVLLIMKLTKKLIFLAVGAVLIALGIYTGAIQTPDALLALPFWL